MILSCPRARAHIQVLRRVSTGSSRLGLAFSVPKLPCHSKLPHLQSDPLKPRPEHRDVTTSRPISRQAWELHSCADRHPLEPWVYSDPPSSRQHQDTPQVYGTLCFSSLEKPGSRHPQLTYSWYKSGTTWQEQLQSPGPHHCRVQAQELEPSTGRWVVY